MSVALTALVRESKLEVSSDERSGSGLLWFLRVDPYVLVGVFPLLVALGYCCGAGAHGHAEGVQMSIQRVIQDPVPFLILFGLILLTVWLWRRFKGR